MEKIKCSSMYGNITKTGKEIKIGDKLVVKNEMRYFDIVEVLEIYESINYGNLLYEIQSIAFGEKRMICFDYILGILDIVEGVNIREQITEKRK